MKTASPASRPAIWHTQMLAWGPVITMIVLSWLYLVTMRTCIPDALVHNSAAMGHVGQNELIWAIIMWNMMMAAMMLPTAMPAMSLFSTLCARRSQVLSPRTSSLFYIVGYLASWSGYSVAAATLQWGLLHLQVLNHMTMGLNAGLSVFVLVVAGIFQFTSLKEACLSKCRTPMAFFLSEWRDGKRGAFILGLRHGTFCVACCWALMAVMFVVGTMNILWMAILTIFVLCEKVAPPSWHISQAGGIALLVWAAIIACF